MAEKHIAGRRGSAHAAHKAHDILAAEAFVLPAPDPALHRERAHDVLAAEEFGMPAPDPALHREPAHDVLAAEQFVMPAPDPVLHRHGPVVLPADPSGIAGAHDVLAAEEFAMPAPRPGGPAGVGASGPTRTPGPVLAGALGAVAGAVVVLARRGRRRRRRNRPT